MHVRGAVAMAEGIALGVTVFRAIARGAVLCAGIGALFALAICASGVAAAFADDPAVDRAASAAASGLARDLGTMSPSAAHRFYWDLRAADGTSRCGQFTWYRFRMT